MGLRIDPVPACGSKSSERLSFVKVKEFPLPLLLQIRRWRCVFFVVADDPLDGADLEYGALDAAHCQRNRAKRHDRSPKKIRGRLARRCESDGTPGYTRQDHISRHSRASELVKTVALPFDVSVSAIRWSGLGWCAPGTGHPRARRRRPTAGQGCASYGAAPRYAALPAWMPGETMR